MNKIAVIGAGSWGTALACIVSHNAQEVLLYARNEAVVDSINQQHINIHAFPGIILPNNIKATNDIIKLAGSDLIVLAMPAQMIRAFMLEYVKLNIVKPILICAKGIENESKKLLTAVLAELGIKDKVAILSGPNFASEIVLKKFSSTTIASADHALLQAMMQLFQTPYFRVECVTDIIGVQWCGAVKNVYAIAAGLAYGFKLGDNFHAILIKKALDEMEKLLQQFGGDAQTVRTYAGIGDLVLTCSSITSRNMKLGQMIATQVRSAGRARVSYDIKEFLSHTTAEGYYTTNALHDMILTSNQRYSLIKLTHQAIHGEISERDLIAAVV